jgi:hypothetical protein
MEEKNENQREKRQQGNILQERECKFTDAIWLGLQGCKGGGLQPIQSLIIFHKLGTTQSQVIVVRYKIPTH